MKNLAIITARSGSKGLPDKNIKELAGKPLMWYTINAALISGMYDEVMVSTDSERYAEIAISCGAKVPILRSDVNSGDTASSWDVVREVIEYYKKQGEVYDTVTLLQPTSPLRTHNHIIEGFELLKEKGANSVIGVVEEEHSPLWANVLPEDMSMEGFINKGLLGIPRQELKPYYRINGALYIVKTDVLDQINDLYDNKCYAYIMNREASVDIDTEFDFKMAEVILTSEIINES